MQLIRAAGWFEFAMEKGHQQPWESENPSAVQVGPEPTFDGSRADVVEFDRF